MNATSNFQTTLTRVLEGLKLHDLGGKCAFFNFKQDWLIIYVLELILELSEEVGLYTAAHKCTLFETSITWCAKVYVKHDSERLTALATMRRPETAGELMQFLQAVNWLRTSLPCLAEVVYPLRVSPKEHLADAKVRTTRVASILAISAGDWTSGLIGGWKAAQDLVAHAVALSHPKPEWAVLMFPGASD